MLILPLEPYTAESRLRDFRKFVFEKRTAASDGFPARIERTITLRSRNVSVPSETILATNR